MLHDLFDREIHYLRLSVINHCNFHCLHCQPQELHDVATAYDWLTGDEIERLAAQFAALGVTHIRLTGGEPLLRHDLGEIATRLAALPGIEELSLSTNASRLADQASMLRQAGVRRLNIRLDSLNESTFKHITGGQLQPVLRGVETAVEQGFKSIKINMVILNGINDHEVEAMIDYCLDHGLTLRFIEAMPLDESGIRANAHYLPLSKIERRLRLRHGLSPTVIHGSGPARYLRIDDSELVVGFISPHTRRFCESCNRVRLSATGDLHPCISQEEHLSLRPLLRENVSDQAIRHAILQAIARKPHRQRIEKTSTAMVRPAVVEWRQPQQPGR